MTSLLTVYPSRITITPERKRNSINDSLNVLIKQKNKAIKNTSYKLNFKAAKNPFKLSKTSKRKLFDSINAMYVLSAPRKITMQTGKCIYNYKMSFITLTLPSKQQHNDTFIKSECLNQFLVEIRKHYAVNNYVWKAELQRNKNIHFHLIIDKYIDYQALRRRWNRILNKHNYVNVYKEKMSKLTFRQYVELRRKSKKTDIRVIHKSFKAGKKSKWANPNTVDVKSVYSKKDLAVYLSKYVTKQVSNQSEDAETLKREISFGRSWSRSYSLAQLSYKNKLLLSECLELINYLKSIPKLVKHVIGNWYEVFYFNISCLSNEFKAFHNTIMLANASLSNYPFP